MVLGHASTLEGYIGLGTAWANKVNFVMNYAPGAGSIAQPVDQQSMVTMVLRMPPILIEKLLMR